MACRLQHGTLPMSKVGFASYTIVLLPNVRRTIYALLEQGRFHNLHASRSHRYPSHTNNTFDADGPLNFNGVIFKFEFEPILSDRCPSFHAPQNASDWHRCSSVMLEPT
jgi:hypothetical protein